MLLLYISEESGFKLSPKKCNNPEPNILQIKTKI